MQSCKLSRWKACRTTERRRGSTAVLGVPQDPANPTTTEFPKTRRSTLADNSLNLAQTQPTQFKPCALNLFRWDCTYSHTPHRKRGTAVHFPWVGGRELIATQDRNTSAAADHKVDPRPTLNPTAHKPSRTLETRCLDAQCTCHTHTHTAAVVPGIYPSIEEVHSGTQWLNCHRPSDPSNSGGSPNRAGGRVQQKIEKTRHCSSQAKLQTHARRKSMTVHVLVRVCGMRWPKAQPTPARPDPLELCCN